jgi:hypothetical protein
MKRRWTIAGVTFIALSFLAPSAMEVLPVVPCFLAGLALIGAGALCMIQAEGDIK